MIGLRSEALKFTKVLDAVGAGTAATNTTAVDMAGYDGVIFLTSFGTAAANNVTKAQCSSDNGSSDAFADMTGTGLGVGSSDEDQWVDVFRPVERYVRAVITPDTSSTIENCWAIQYGAQSLPVDNTTSGTIYGEGHVSPAEGTA